jgi:hypothetical protein
MRRFRSTSRGLSLIELAVSMASASIAMLIGLTAWGVGWTQYENVENASRAYLDAFGVMNSIEEQVQRCTTIQVPDPDNPSVNSIQLLIPNQSGSGTLRRAYRRVGNTFIMQWKDENVGPVTVFSDVTSFTATILNAPTNSLVQLNCTCADGTATVSTTTVAAKRN